MANVDRPEGFRPKGDVLRANKYISGSAVYPGDAVTLDSSGRAAAATATQALVGVAASYASAAGESILVYDHPEQLYSVQSDGADVDAQTDMNLNYDLVATAGSSSYRVSRMELDANTGAVTATLPLKLLAIEDKIDNALGAFVKCIVKINNHQLAGGTGTDGI